MVEDGEQPTPFHDIAKRLEQFCPASEAERVMVRGLRTPLHSELQGPLLPNQLQFYMRMLRREPAHRGSFRGSARVLSAARPPDWGLCFLSSALPLQRQLGHSQRV